MTAIDPTVLALLAAICADPEFFRTESAKTQKAKRKSAEKQHRPGIKRIPKLNKNTDSRSRG